jgi:hypothetical protein
VQGTSAQLLLETCNIQALKGTIQPWLIREFSLVGLVCVAVEEEASISIGHTCLSVDSRDPWVVASSSHLRPAAIHGGPTKALAPSSEMYSPPSP